MSYRKVGYFYELPDEEKRSTLSSLRRDGASEDEAKVVEYLASGIDAGAVMMIEHDILAEPSQAIGEVLLKSDGEWIWPVSLIYYVEKYHVALPKEFTDHMAENNWQIPSNAEYVPEIPEGHVEM